MKVTKIKKHYFYFAYKGLYFHSSLFVLFHLFLQIKFMKKHQYLACKRYLHFLTI
jgi:hypothetical protein